jgi:hypothetical protein
MFFGFVNYNKIMLNIAEDKPNPDVHIPEQSPFLNGKCWKALSNGKKYPTPIKNPYPIP